MHHVLYVHVVKVVCDAAGMAMYFSRAPIAWWRDRPANAPAALPHPAPLRHIGIYSYRAGFLRSFPSLAQAPMEVSEALEQLRALWHGHKIAVYVSAIIPGPGVDTPQDLERVRALFANGFNKSSCVLPGEYATVRVCRCYLGARW